MNYRPEIDGLRTIAVIPVVIYHLKIGFLGGYLLQGGFIGVDVFFVISGFLITRILLNEVTRKGRISLAGFYARRVRRILPALILVLLASTAAIFLIPTQTDVRHFLQSSLAALGFASNAFWYLRLGEYGAPAGVLNPLLHTWSLAVEEQFYVVFPLLLILLRPGKRPWTAFVTIVVLLLASLVVAEISTRLWKEFSFFSTASRAWELLAGSAIAFGQFLFPQASAVRSRGEEAIPKIALAVLLVSMFTISLEDQAHPGLITLPAVLATAALIWFAQPGEAVTRMLSSPVPVFIGRLSYSIYLWHFPVFAFGRLITPEAPGVSDKLVWVALTAVFSVAGYYLVERPFRFSLGTRSLSRALGTSAVVIVALVAIDMQDRFLPTGSDRLERLYGGPYYDNQLLARQNETFTKDGKERHMPSHEPSRVEREESWFSDSGTIRILVVGDSHSRDMFHALRSVVADFPGMEVARFGMDRFAYNESHMEMLFASPNFRAADVIMLAKRYTRDLADIVPRVVTAIQARGKPVVIAGNTVEIQSYEPYGRWSLYDVVIQRDGREGLSRLNRMAYDLREGHVLEFNRRLRTVARDLGAPYLSRMDLVCPPGEKICMLVTGDGGKVLYDYGHWTLAGAAMVGRRIVETDWLAPVFEVVCGGRTVTACSR